MRKTMTVLLVLGGAVLAGCHRGDMAMADKPVAEPSLYQRLGGQPAIIAVTDDFVANVAADPVINKRFAKTDIMKLKQSIVTQICAATGGPCTYTGKSMEEAHRGMNITTAEFNAMGADMLKTLEKFRVPEREKTELMTLLGSMQGDIVGK